MRQFSVHTQEHTQFVNITTEIQHAVNDADVKHGVCHVFIPHTTAGITINENADPDVVRDLIATLERLVPWRGDYRHDEGNSAAHLKASLMGSTQTVIIQDGRLALGTWQSIYFCEFDGPRDRKAWIEIIPAG